MVTGGTLRGRDDVASLGVFLQADVHVFVHSADDTAAEQLRVLSVIFNAAAAQRLSVNNTAFKATNPWLVTLSEKQRYKDTQRSLQP